MNKILSIFLLYVLATIKVMAAASSTNWTLSPEGIGPIHIGMSLSQAERASGMRFNPITIEDYEDKTCYYVTLKGIKPLSFMVNGKTIVRVNVSSPAYVTNFGAKVGDSVAQVKSLYKGTLVSEPHHYDSKGQYLTFIDKAKNRAIRFETDGKVITLIYSGKENEVHFVEDCL